ncbi:MAG TPA: hypothetical protein DDZ88_05330 [Verrucomicrobiales bacterium]|nr:hypothetical protein [Verrucomicrobiales bacterium]
MSPSPQPHACKIDNAWQLAQHERHEQNPAATPSERCRDAQGFDEAAAALAGAGAASGGSLAEVQVQRLIAWAQNSQRLIAEPEFERLPLVSDETGEHEVRFHEPDRRVWKKTWPGTFGMMPEWSPEGWKPAYATPLEYLERFILHNALFQDDVRLEGVVITAQPPALVGAVPGGCSMVISQRWLIAADDQNPHPIVSQISAYMQERGFKPLPDSFFGWFREDDGVIVLDAKPDNFVLTPDGILPFDLVLARGVGD